MRHHTFMFVNEDKDTILQQLSKIQYQYLEYVIEENKEIVRVRGIIRFGEAKSTRSAIKRLGADTLPKPINMSWKAMWNSFEQANTKNTILVHEMHGKRPDPGHRTDLETGVYLYMPN